MPECQLSREYVVDIGQTDCRGLARPSAIVDFMQDIATRHAEIMGIGGEALKQHHGFWVLSRLKYQLERPLQPYETVRLTTLPRKLRGASWYRDFVFEDAGGVIGHAVTVWAIVDLESRHLLLPKKVGISFPSQDTGFTEQLRAIVPEDMQPCFARTVRYSDTDVNRHLNNVKAVDILSDAFGLEPDKNRWVSELQVNYLAENRCGTELTISQGHTKNGTFCVCACEGEQEKVQAEVTFSER